MLRLHVPVMRLHRVPSSGTACASFASSMELSWTAGVWPAAAPIHRAGRGQCQRVARPLFGARCPAHVPNVQQAPAAAAEITASLNPIHCAALDWSRPAPQPGALLCSVCRHQLAMPACLRESLSCWMLLLQSDNGTNDGGLDGRRETELSVEVSRAALVSTLVAAA